MKGGAVGHHVAMAMVPVVVLAAGVAALGCAPSSTEDRSATALPPVEVGPEAVPDAPPVEYVGAEAGDGHRPMRFADGQVSLNDQCPVRKRGLNLRMPAVYVNGAPIGFC